MKLQVLVSAVDEKTDTLAERMNLESDALIINQTDHFGYEEYMHNGRKVQCYSFQEKGVGLSRIMHCFGRRQILYCSPMRISSMMQAMKRGFWMRLKRIRKLIFCYLICVSERRGQPIIRKNITGSTSGMQGGIRPIRLR